MEYGEENMKLYISDVIQEQLERLPAGTKLLGTYSIQFGVASVTDIHRPDESGHYGTRKVLATIGDESSEPFGWVSPGGWTFEDGSPVDVEVYHSGDFFKRTPFNPEIMAHLRKERVLIIGTGSVGAPMGLELARSGIGTIIAVDKDILEIHNCMRHVLGTAYIGWPKPVAFKHYLEEHVPTCDCIPVFENIFKGDRSRLRDVIEETRPTRILAVTDSLSIQYLCQLTALHYGIPLMAVWCDNNAVEGEIYFWEPGQASAWKPGRPQRGCYACMRDPDQITITRSEHFDYSSDDPDSYGGEPALGTFINRVNNIATIYMTAWMLRDCPVKTKLAGILDQHYEGKGLQYIRLGGPYPFEAEGQITANAPWAVEWYRVRKRDECPFCGDMRNVEEKLFRSYAEETRQADNWNNFEEPVAKTR